MLKENMMVALFEYESIPCGKSKAGVFRVVPGFVAQQEA